MKTKNILFLTLSLVLYFLISSYAQANHTHHYSVDVVDSVEVINTAPTPVVSYYWFLKAEGKQSLFVNGDEPRVRLVLTSDVADTHQCTSRLVLNLKSFFEYNYPSPGLFSLVSGNTNVDLIGHTGIPLCAANWTAELTVFNKHNGERVLRSSSFSTIPVIIPPDVDDTNDTQKEEDQNVNEEEYVPPVTDENVPETTPERVSPPSTVKKTKFTVKASSQKLRLTINNAKKKKITVKIYRSKKLVRTVKSRSSSKGTLVVKHKFRKGKYKISVTVNKKTKSRNITIK